MVTLALELLAFTPEVFDVLFHPLHVARRLFHIGSIHRLVVRRSVPLSVIVEVLEHDQLFGCKILVTRQAPDLVIQAEDALFSSSHLRTIDPDLALPDPQSSSSDDFVPRFDSMVWRAGMAEWKTRRTQNPLGESPWGFESPSRYRPHIVRRDPQSIL
jgi:hypothetical protein